MAKIPPKISGLLKMGVVGESVESNTLPDIQTGESAYTTSSQHENSFITPPSVDARFTSESELHLIPIDLIDPNPFAPREIYTAEMLLRRADDLRTQGQHDPIHVIPNPELPGRFIIADGWTRVQACRTHKVREKLKSQIHLGLSVQDAAWFGYEQNEGREQHCDFDRAMFYEKLIAEGMSSTEVARRAHVPKATMTMYRAFAKLPNEIIQFVKDKPHKFGHRAAYELNRIFEAQGVRKAVAVAAKYCDEDQTHRWLVNQTQAVLHPSTHKTASALKHIRYANGFYKQKSDAFELSIQVPPEKRDAFASALEALLNTVAIEASSELKTKGQLPNPEGKDET